MKFDTHRGYDPHITSRSLPSFLTIWPTLSRYHHDLVLVGGLVPHFICTHASSETEIPRPATLDVDLGIAFGATGGQYGTISSELQGLGYRADAQNQARLVRKDGPYELYLDFLVDDGIHTQGSVRVDDILANVMPGVDRALQSARSMKVAGVDLFGAPQKVIARVCEIGPYLALKLRAFYHRQQPKDAFDIYYTLRHYDGGTNAALEAFGNEKRVGNRACQDAIQCLRAHFDQPHAAGPVRASHFILGPSPFGDTEEGRYRRDTIQAEMQLMADLLLQA